MNISSLQCLLTDSLFMQILYFQTFQFSLPGISFSYQITSFFQISVYMHSNICFPIYSISPYYKKSALSLSHCKCCTYNLSLYFSYSLSFKIQAFEYLFAVLVFFDLWFSIEWLILITEYYQGLVFINVLNSWFSTSTHRSM